jgi:hypothetical protein
MEIQEAVTIMRALAAGLEPETGNPMQSDCLCLKPAVVKALNRALGALLQLEQRERGRPQNAFRTWTRKEEAQVCEEVRNGMDFHEIARAHSRSVGSIVARLVKLGKIAPAGSPPRAA